MAPEQPTTPSRGNINLGSHLGVAVGTPGLAGNPAEFSELISSAQTATGLLERQLAKDYWLTTCLFHIAQGGGPSGMLVHRKSEGRQEPSAVCLFTGGTGLVSAWGIGERFSEDLDFLAADLTRSEADGTLKKARSQIARWALTPLGQTSLEAQQSDDRRKGFRKILLPVGDEPDYLKIEIASEEIDDSHYEPRKIISLMGRSASPQQLGQYPELGGFELLCTKPAYTAANKLDALHRRAAFGHFRELAVRIRDLYDLAMIAQSERAADARQQIPQLAETATLTFDRRGDPVPRPAGGYAQSIMFQDGSEAHQHLKVAYPALADFVWGSLPSFDEAVELAASLDSST